MAQRAKIQATDATVSVFVPLKLKRMQGRKHVLAPHDREGCPVSKDASAQKAMVLALARAHRWKELLETGQVKSVTELANTFGVDGSYVGRILRLTLLAPDIVEDILEGREPDGLSLAKLTKTLPVEWGEQRQVFGVT
jgi:hypothetical protein